MVLLQPKLSLRVSQKQILTPGLVQMVSVLALNKLELADMINAELTENPVLEELEDSVPLLDEVSAREEKMDRESSAAVQEELPKTAEEKDPFEEIDFGTFFSEYLDPGLRTSIEMEDSEKPSFENFLSRPTTLTDHLMWQLGSLHVKEDVYRAAELIIGNLNEDGYLTATEDELLGLMEDENGPLEWPVAASVPESPSSASDVTQFEADQPHPNGHQPEAPPLELSLPNHPKLSWKRPPVFLRRPMPRSPPVLRSCRHAPLRRVFRSAAMLCAKLSTWCGNSIPLVLVLAICVSVCWLSFKT